MKPTTPKAKWNKMLILLIGLLCAASYFLGTITGYSSALDYFDEEWEEELAWENYRYGGNHIPPSIPTKD